MATGMKAVSVAHIAKDRVQSGVLKLDHLVALLAVEMLVLRIAVIVLEEGAIADLEPAQ
jgi:hypothetical protein